MSNSILCVTFGAGARAGREGPEWGVWTAAGAEPSFALIPMCLRGFGVRGCQRTLDFVRPPLKGSKIQKQIVASPASQPTEGPPPQALVLASD